MTLKEEFFEQFENKIGLFYCGMIWNWTEEKIDKAIDDALTTLNKTWQEHGYVDHNFYNIAFDEIQRLKEKK
jgi:hypothetical protein